MYLFLFCFIFIPCCCAYSLCSFCSLGMLCAVWLDWIGADNAMRSCRRHLVRLWLRDPELAWETPPELRQRWADVYDGVTADSQVFPLEPTIRSSSDATKQGSGGY